jgi:DNA (cytosine-5)-methyltransferase 1
MAMQPIPLNTMAMQGRPGDKEGRMGSGIGQEGDPCPTLTKAHSHAVTQGMAVRRLTPVECERLQGFPDSYTNIPWRKKPASECPDGPRYKALGNSWAVPVVRWIGKRIQEAIQC